MLVTTPRIFLRLKSEEPLLVHHHHRVRDLELQQGLQRALGRSVDVRDGLREVEMMSRVMFELVLTLTPTRPSPWMSNIVVSHWSSSTT